MQPSSPIPSWHSTLSRVNVNSSRSWECLAFDSVMGHCQLLKKTTTKQQQHGSAWHSTRSRVNVTKHGSAWHLTWSWVNANSSKKWECLAFDPVMGQCQLLNRHGHSTLSWVNVNSSIDMGIRLCHGSMSTPPEHWSAWNLTRSQVNVNSSSIRECLVSMSTPSRGVETHCSVID